MFPSFYNENHKNFFLAVYYQEAQKRELVQVMYAKNKTLQQ